MQRSVSVLACLLLDIPCAAGANSVNTSITITTHANSSEPLLTPDSVQLEVVPGDAGEAVFRGDELQWLSLAGEPAVPWKVLTVLLPPDVELSTLSVSMRQSQFEPAVGTWTVPPTPPMLTLYEDQAVEEWPEGKRIVDGRDVDIYEHDAFWPEEQVRLLGTGQLHKWQLAEVAVPLAKYNPVRGELMLLAEAEIEISFRCGSTIKLQSIRAESSSRVGGYSAWAVL